MSLQQQLSNMLLAQHDAKIISSTEHTYPMHNLQIQYYPVRKTPMDILMKMMLIAFNKAPIKATEVLANILLVEPLFIEDLTAKMLRLKMIEKSDDQTFVLTEKGQAQLETGIFEEQLELVTEELYYSTIHEMPLNGDIEAILELDNLPEPLDYVDETIASIHEKNVVDYVQEHKLDEAIDDESDTQLQAFVSSIESFSVGQIQDIPIYKFILKEHRSARLFTRVFNMYTNDFDEVLEQFITEREKGTWTNLK